MGVLAGDVSGAIATIPVPGLGGLGSSIVMGGTGNVAAGVINGNVKNLNDAAGAFNAGGMGYGKGKATIGKAAALWGGLNRTAQKQALRRFGNVS